MMQTVCCTMKPKGFFPVSVQVNEWLIMSHVHSPLGEHFKVNTLMVDDEIPYGKPLDFFVDIPLENFSLMVIWGNDLGYSRKVGKGSDQCHFGLQQLLNITSTVSYSYNQ